jgi:DNA ligase-1
MRLAELAQAFERLEESRSRRTMVQIVAELLAQARPGEIAPVVYLLQAQLRPPYEGIEIGLGEKLLVKAVSRAFGKTVRAVVARFRRTGDLGLVAGALAPNTGAKRLSVDVAYENLLRIARSAGTGSQLRKIELLSTMLRSVGAPEAKLLVRVAQGRLRLGTGDQTILEAAALAALGDRTLKRCSSGPITCAPILAVWCFSRSQRGNPVS